jgi:hypothetical protein
MRDGGDAAKTNYKATQLQDGRMPKHTIDPKRGDDTVEQRLQKQRSDRIDEEFRREHAENVDFSGHGAHPASDKETGGAKSGAFGSKLHRMPTSAFRQVKSSGAPLPRRSAKAAIASSMDKRIVASPSSTCMGLRALK